MTVLQAFNFDGATVRTTTGADGEPWFVAADVASVLDYRMASDMTRILDDEEKGTQIVSTLGGDQSLTTINESGLYAAILKSRKPEAKRFKKWVTSEVLPSIRKTGAYGAQADPMAVLSDPAAMRTLLLGYTEKVIALEGRVSELAPKAAALDLISASEEAVTVTQAAKILGVKRETLTNWMHANGWIYRQNGAWVAHQQHINNGRLQFKEARYTDQNTGQECRRPYCHIFPKGLAALAKHFGQKEAA